MVDIVERLREAHEEWGNFSGVQLWAEAADEIGRLRKALRHIADYHEFTLRGQCQCAAHSEARAALRLTVQQKVDC